MHVKAGNVKSPGTDVEVRETGKRTAQLLEQLTALWEKSVRATHLFLSDDEIEAIKGYVPQGLCSVSRLVVAEENGEVVAFMGINGRKVECSLWTAGTSGKASENSSCCTASKGTMSAR